MSNPKDFFLLVTERIFSNWTALKIAVEHGMGSKEKAQAFCPYVTELFFMNENLIPAEIAAELEDYMDVEFNTELEDNSAIQVAEELVRFYRLCVSDSENMSLKEFENLPPLQSWMNTQISTKSVSQSTSQKNDSTSESDEASNDQMEVEDEWTTVRTRRKK